MNWSDERYVRLYTRDSRNWRRMGWQARCLLVMLLRKVDRAGVLELEENWTAEDLAEELSLPDDVVQVGLTALEQLGTVTSCHRQSPSVTNVTRGHARLIGVTIPNFLEAQETRQTDAARQRASREQRRAKGSGSHVASPDVTSRDARERNENAVTSGHQVSPDVTPAFLASLDSLTSLTNQPPERARARETRSKDLDQREDRNRNGANGAVNGSGRLAYAVPGSTAPAAAPMEPTPRTGDEVTPEEAVELKARLLAAVKLEAKERS